MMMESTNSKEKYNMGLNMKRISNCGGSQNETFEDTNICNRSEIVMVRQQIDQKTGDQTTENIIKMHPTNMTRNYSKDLQHHNKDGENSKLVGYNQIPNKRPNKNSNKPDHFLEPALKIDRKIYE